MLLHAHISGRQIKNVSFRVCTPDSIKTALSISFRFKLWQVKGFIETITKIGLLGLIHNNFLAALEGAEYFFPPVRTS